MRTVSSVGIGLSLITASLLLVLLAEIYYLFWWKKISRSRSISSSNNNNGAVDHQDEANNIAKDFLYMLLCFKRPSSSSSLSTSSSLSSNTEQQLKPTQEQDTNPTKDFVVKSEDSIEAELMRLHGLTGPPRFLFTIKEETKEELESEDGRKRGKSLSDFLASPHVFTPPLTPLNYYKQAEFNPLFESCEELSKRMWTSPPPKLKFLRDAEEKLYRKSLKEEKSKVESIINNGGTNVNNVEEDGSFITIVIGKSSGQHLNHLASSQVIPLSFNATNSKTTSPNSLL